MSQAEVVAALKEHGEMTSKEIAEHTGSPLNTTRQSISRLKRKHEIEDIPVEGRKRPGPFYKYRLKEPVRSEL